MNDECPAVHNCFSRLGNIGIVLFAKGWVGYACATQKLIAPSSEISHFANSKNHQFCNSNYYSYLLAYILVNNMAAFAASCILLGRCCFWAFAETFAMNLTSLKLAVIFGLAIFNGVSSSWTFVIFALQGIWYPAFLPSPLTFMLILSGVISALLHAMMTAVPASICEKLWPRQVGANLSAFIWLAMMMLPTWQTLRHLEMI